MNRLWMLCIGAGLGISTVRAQTTYNMNGFLTCVSVNQAAGTLTAYFGYESFEQSVVQIIVGSLNSFLPDPANRNQPTLYLPGYFEKAFRVTVPLGDSLLWLFNGGQIFADQNQPQCASTTVTTSLLKLPPGLVGSPYSQQLAAIGAQSTLLWSGSGLPMGLNVTQGGFITGTPQAAGQFTVTVQTTDGFTVSASTYSLTINSALTINDAASTRPQGFSPQFRLATLPSSTISATVSCNANEFVITGGGTCTVPNSNTVQGRVASSQPATNGWTVVCSGGTATAVAICSLQ